MLISVALLAVALALLSLVVIVKNALKNHSPYEEFDEEAKEIGEESGLTSERSPPSHSSVGLQMAGLQLASEEEGHPGNRYTMSVSSVCEDLEAEKRRLRERLQQLEEYTEGLSVSGDSKDAEDESGSEAEFKVLT